MDSEQTTIPIYLQDIAENLTFQYIFYGIVASAALVVLLFIFYELRRRKKLRPTPIKKISLYSALLLQIIEAPIVDCSYLLSKTKPAVYITARTIELIVMGPWLFAIVWSLHGRNSSLIMEAKWERLITKWAKICYYGSCIIPFSSIAYLMKALGFMKLNIQDYVIILVGLLILILNIFYVYIYIVQYWLIRKSLKSRNIEQSVAVRYGLLICAFNFLTLLFYSGHAAMAKSRTGFFMMMTRIFLECSVITILLMKRSFDSIDDSSVKALQNMSKSNNTKSTLKSPHSLVSV